MHLSYIVIVRYYTIQMHSFSLFATLSSSRVKQHHEREHERAQKSTSSSSSSSTINEREGKPIKPGQSYPAKRALLELRFVRFISYIVRERRVRVSRTWDVQNRKVGREVHGKRRNTEAGQLRLGVYLIRTRKITRITALNRFYAKKKQPVEKAQWTGIVTSVALEMLRTKAVRCVVSVGSRKRIEEPGTEVVLYRGRYFSVQRSETLIITKLESFRGN